MTYLLLLIIFCSLQNSVQAQPLSIEGEATVKYESLQYKTPGIADLEFIERTIRINAKTPLSAQTSLFLRLGHQSYSGNSTDSDKTALDQYGLIWKNPRQTLVIGSQDTYLGAYGAMFDNSSNVGEGMFRGVDIRADRGLDHYHFVSGRLDPALFEDARSRTFFGTEFAHYLGDTRLLASYLHIPNLPKKTDDFVGFSINSPIGKGELLSEFVHSSASTANQALLVGINYQATDRQAFKLVVGQLLDNAIPEGKSSLGGYDNGIRGFQVTAIQALDLSNRIATKYTRAETVTSDIPIRKIEIEYTHLF
ncbi:hypothetical protein [Pelosinus sp. sgz500959]|uniref:hypothetical protein n=1 Tax=Pelosinus sp. sgz500959 TaxID=3242472 RepID=UPI00366F6732